MGRPAVERTGAAPALLVARGVSKAHRVGGSFVSVVGPSGSGKTTLPHGLSGIDAIDSGTVEIGGEDVRGEDASALVCDDLTPAGSSNARDRCCIVSLYRNSTTSLRSEP